MTLYLRPQALDRLGKFDPPAVPLAGGPMGFAACDILQRTETGSATQRQLDLRNGGADEIAALGPAASRLIERISRPRDQFAGLDLSTPRVMGVINVTPDSFSDGGDRFDPARAIADGLSMADDGADIIDVGGESTRPGAGVVTLEEELRRTIPVVRGLADRGLCVSIDTRHARVMAEALSAGAAIVNDISALSDSGESLSVVAEAGCSVVLMHKRGEPRTMQANPNYRDAPLDIFDYLSAQVERCESAGLKRSQIAIDPGIGFGKTLAHNLELLDQLALFHGIGYPVLLGVSRKGFIGKLSRQEAPKDRLSGSLAAVLAGIQRGAQILRVHDVAETQQALRLWEAIASADGQSAS